MAKKSKSSTPRKPENKGAAAGAAPRSWEDTQQKPNNKENEVNTNKTETTERKDVAAVNANALASTNGGKGTVTQYKIEDDVPIPSSSRRGTPKFPFETLRYNEKTGKGQSFEVTVAGEKVKDLAALGRRMRNAIHAYQTKTNAGLAKGTGHKFSARVNAENNSIRIFCVSNHPSMEAEGKEKESKKN